MLTKQDTGIKKDSGGMVVESATGQEATNGHTPDDQDHNSPTPLPKFQLFLVYLIPFAEPVTATVIYPFVNQFVSDTGVTGGDERKTGYYAGIIGSVFFLAEVLTVFHWGQVSDRIGRRPVLLLGPVGLALSMFCFGLSTEFWTLVASRSLQSVFNGVIGVSKTIIAELTDSTNIRDAYAFMQVVWSIGFTVGPSVGGLLAEPAERWPDIFENRFFIRHPYFVPCAAAGAFSAVSAILGCFGLRETLPSALRKPHNAQNWSCKPTDEDNETASLLTNSETSTRYDGAKDQGRQIVPSVEEPTPFRNLLNPRVVVTLLVYTFQAFNTMALTMLQPLIYSTSISAGGLGLSAYEIGLILTTFGFVNAASQLFGMGTLMRRLGPRKINISNHIATLLHTMFYPLLIATVRRQARLANGFGWGSIQILIIESAPSRASLGATNGLAQAVGCVTRAVAPTVASSLFSYSIEKRYMDGNLVYSVLTFFAFAGIWTSFWLPQPARTQK